MLETPARLLRQVEAAPRRALVDFAPDLSQVPADRFRRGLRGRRPSQPPESRLRFDLLSFERILLNGEKAPPRILETAPWSYLVRLTTFARGYGGQEAGHYVRRRLTAAVAVASSSPFRQCAPCETRARPCNRRLPC